LKLSTILKPELIKADCTASNIDELFSEVIDILNNNGYISDKKLIYKKLLDREKLGSTSIGNNAAIPHAKIKNLDQTIVFIALSKNGINFNNLDKVDCVNLIIFIISPINSPVSHLQTLAAAASLIKNHPNFVKMTNSLNSFEILDYIRGTEDGYD